MGTEIHVPKENEHGICSDGAGLPMGGDRCDHPGLCDFWRRGAVFLGGVIAEAPTLPAELPLYILAAVVGGGIGSGLGARRISDEFIRLLLALVLLIAAGKMLLAGFS